MLRNGAPDQTAGLTLSDRRKKPKRFQRVGHGLFRMRSTGTIYAVFKVSGKTRWKSLGTDDPTRARLLLADEIQKSSSVDWKQAANFSIRQIIEIHNKNSMRLAENTLRIRKMLLKVFERTWEHGVSMKVNSVKPIMLMTWLAKRRKDQSLTAAGVNNYVRMLHRLFQFAVDVGAVSESPAKNLKLLKEASPIRLTPSWEQANTIIGSVKGQNAKDVLSAMLLLGLGQAELKNLRGEHIDFERNQIVVRRQKTQRVFIISIYPQAKSLLERLKSEGQIAPGKAVFDRVCPREALRLACRKLGLPQFSPRSFRRAFIVRALEKGIDPRCVAAWQGHRDATLVLKVYGHIIQPAHNHAMAERLN